MMCNRLASDELPRSRVAERPSEPWEAVLVVRSAHSISTIDGCAMARRVLVVDDQEDNRRILRDLLTSASYETLEAETGEAGVSLAEAEHPNLILMDLQIPGLDGCEATRRIKANPALRRIPVIAVTSYALSGDEARAREAGCAAYVAKPIRPRALLATIRNHLP
jgi:two-component system cell cycle response regulator DivK